ncbi:MAG: discoidin domain-containing protein [Bacteroidota bacterium]
MRKHITISIIVWLLIGVGQVCSQSILDISGNWQFQLDTRGIGHDSGWYELKQFNDHLLLPGTTDTNAKGFATLPWPVDSITRKFDMLKAFEQPEWIYTVNGAPTRKYKYIGPAWYQKYIEIPVSWEGKRVEVFLERSLFNMELWVDGKKVGKDMSLYAPRIFDITEYVKAGKKHRITLCVDNTNTIGGRAHGYTNHTQTNWNGVVGTMELRSHDAVYNSDVKIFTDIQDKSVRVQTRTTNFSGDEPLEMKYLLTIEDKNGEIKAEKLFERRIEGRESVMNFYILMNETIDLWDEFNPALYQLKVEMTSRNGRYLDKQHQRFGFREIGTNGTTLMLNGRPVMLRGTLDCAIYPKTGYMPMDKASWQKVLGTVKQYGMNHVRYHSVCPPRAAFEVADELGVYIQAEMIWGPWIEGESPIHDYLYNDGFRILDSFGDHPSFVMMTTGNELGATQNKYRNRVIQMFRHADPRRLYTATTGVGETTEVDDIRYAKGWQYGHGATRQGWGIRFTAFENNDFDFSLGRDSSVVPLIIHELGQWVMYPGFDFMKKFDGVLKPSNFEPLYDRLTENGLAGHDRKMAVASGKHGLWRIKQAIEAQLRTKGMGGFQYLGLSDFTGQSEAMVGVLDVFWDSKGYTTPEEFREFCSGTVPLLRYQKWVYTNDEVFQAKASVAHYGPEAISGKNIIWQIKDENGKTIKKGSFGKPVLPVGEITELGIITMGLEKTENIGQYKVEISIEHTPHKNHWDYYVYPASKTVPDPKNIYLVDRFDENAQKKLSEGEDVLLLWDVENFGRNVQKVSYVPQFWSYNCGALGKNYPATAGLLIDNSHPIFNQFSSESYSDARWIDLVEGSNAFVLNDMPMPLSPMVQGIDDLHRNNKLGLIFEAKVGKGRVLACAIDLENDLDNRPVARQFKRSLITYMQSDFFCPKTELSQEELIVLLPDPSSVNSVIEGSSRWPLHDYRDMLDGDPNTFWSSEWNGGWRANDHHYVVIRLGTGKFLSGCQYTPRQDSENGRIREYKFYLSNDAENWGEPVASGILENSDHIQDIRFNDPREAKYVKFETLKEVNNRKWAAVAELQFY